jgi:hypothetical protein
MVELKVDLRVLKLAVLMAALRVWHLVDLLR